MQRNRKRISKQVASSQSLTLTASESFLLLSSHNKLKDEKKPFDLVLMTAFSMNKIKIPKTYEEKNP